MTIENDLQLIFKEIGETVLNYSFLGKGEASTVFKVITDKNTYAVKTALYPERKKKILQESEIRKFFIEKGLDCIPPPIYSDTVIFPNGAVIFEFAEGTKPDFKNIEIIKQFARILGEIHSINFEVIDNGYRNIEKLYSSLEKTIQMINSKYPHLINERINSAFDFALEEYQEIILQEKNKITFAINAQLHGDLSDNFVTDSNSKVWLLDWENSEYGDIMDELSWFLYVNEISLDNRAVFFDEYKKYFPEANGINFEDIYLLFSAVTPVFDICWGIDQMDMNIKQNLEPERKLRDLAISANEWRQFYSDKTSTLIVDGIAKLADNFYKSSGVFSPNAK